MRSKSYVILFILILFSLSLSAQSILVEAESFKDKGGWVVDQQFMDEMGSPYLLAHGLGESVENAKTEIQFKQYGEYRVWVRTKDWVAAWNASGTPGQFEVIINGKPLCEIFGTKYAEWSWQDGGLVNITSLKSTIELHDLTGFEGRCDAILFCKETHFKPTNSPNELKSYRRKLLGTTKSENGGKYDLVVVGGGIAGISTTIMAARNGLRVALVQDRPVVGGNNSSETRVWLNGVINVKPFANLGNIVKELEQEKIAHYGASNIGEIYEDDKKMQLLENEPNVTLFMNSRGNEVRVKNGEILSVIAENIISGRRIELKAPLFADCTGDGILGYLAGADYELSDSIMGKCNNWNIIPTDKITTFPRCPWALDLSNKKFPGRGDTPGSYGIKGDLALGGWYWESGFYRDPFKYNEWVRDWNFRAMYGAWDALKNIDNAYPNHKLNWSAYISGKRESRRLIGDLVLSENDLINSVEYPDALIPTGWDMDVHEPHKDFKDQYPMDSYISYDLHGKYKIPYFIPYRILYSRNISNLFMAGRNVSVTHKALGSVRVMRTGGLMGEVIGYAAYLCKIHNRSPRDVYKNHIEELKSHFK